MTGQTGLIPVYLHDAFQQGEFYRGIQSIMTIHNLKFQGVWDKKTVMDTAGLDAYYLHLINWKPLGMPII